MDPETPDSPDAPNPPNPAVDNFARSVIAAVIRQRALRRNLWDEKLQASDATRGLCGRLARTEVRGETPACEFAEECAEQDELPPLCPLRDEAQTDEKHAT